MALRMGFIGGNGHHYLRQVLSEASKVAVSGDGHDDPAAREFLKRLEDSNTGPKFHWFDRGTDLLDVFKPDILSVGAVYGYNGDWNCAGLSRNIPTITDKPAAATSEQLARLQSLINENPRRVLLTEFDFRCRADFRAARLAVERGDVGEVILASAQKSYRFGRRPGWYADRQAYAGTLMWVASHGIDVIEFVTGQRLTRLVGRGGNLSRPTLPAFEDHVALLAELENGGTGIVHADFLRPDKSPEHGDDRLRVAGSRGVVEVRGQRTQLIDADGVTRDITDLAGAVPSVGRAMVDAAFNGDAALYSTQKTLETAALLLRARDACDAQAWR